MKRLLLLALVLTACDSAVPAVGDSAEVGFEATVTDGASARTVAGAAMTDDLDGSGIRVGIDEDGAAELTVLQLAADDASDEFFLIGLTEEALAVGDYEINALDGDGLELGFAVAYRYDSDGAAEAEAISFADGGTVTVSRVDDEVIAGSFAFTTSVIVGDETPSLEPVSVEGTFVADVREIEQGGTR